MNTDLSKAYELLGVKPGVSSRELKAAHRDLAKVWHPDRFLHDPRLQEKAQEKLKEINEAYDLLSSGKTPRFTPPSPPPRTYTETSSPVLRRRGFNWQLAAVALLVFAAVFAITTKSLLRPRSEPLPDEQAQVEGPADVPAAARPDSNTRAEVRDVPQKSERTDSTIAETPSTVASEPTPALATVTVNIDPESGLIAGPGCPLRSRMTYPSGSAPTGHCNINHTPPPKESRIKSIATKILPQKRKEAN